MGFGHAVYRNYDPRARIIGHACDVVLNKLGKTDPLLDIAKRLEQTGDPLLGGKQSALYPVLRNLSAAGLAESHVEPSVSGPPRRYYRITALGSQVLAEWAGAWRTTRDSVDSVLEGNLR